MRNGEGEEWHDCVNAGLRDGGSREPGAERGLHLEYEPEDAGKYLLWKIVPNIEIGCSVIGEEHGDYEPGKTVGIRLCPTQNYNRNHAYQAPDYTISMKIDYDGNGKLSTKETFPFLYKLSWGCVGLFKKPSYYR